MDLKEAKNLAIELMDKHGLLDTGWHFEFDNAKRRFGVCRHRRKLIGLSEPLVQLNGIEKVKDTILHEIAHALVGVGHGHDHVWKAKAIEIGCNGQRCYDSKVVATPEAKYIANCPQCNHVHKRHKRPKFGVKHSCGHCSTKFNPNTILVWVENEKAVCC